MTENISNENSTGDELNREEKITGGINPENEKSESTERDIQSNSGEGSDTDPSEVNNSEQENLQDQNSDDSNTGEDQDNRFQVYFNAEVENNNPKVTDKLLTFYELRSIDEELTDIEFEKGDLPEKIASIKLNISTFEKSLSEKNEILGKLEEEKNNLTAENNSYEERINKYDEQKYDVRSNDEYDEIVKTIESLFEEVKKNEERLKVIENLCTKHNTEKETQENKFSELSVELTEKQTLLDELNEQYKTEESDLREKRNVLLARIDDAGRALYERINRSYKGEATAIVRKGNCSGCYNSIPPQRVIEIRSAEKLFTCQSCGRILISEDLVAQAEN